MNVSHPIASSIGSVSFGLLSPQDIKAISVKRIENTETFDTLLHPVPGGLYDSALGAWGDNLCSTCQLNASTCPGHPGHIQLPVPVYHVSFMNQLMLLLRSRCVYCDHFKLAPVEVNRFLCKLRLIKHGLVGEVGELENVQLGRRSFKEFSFEGAGGEFAQDSESDSELEDTQVLERQRELFVKKAIDQQKLSSHLNNSEHAKIEVVDRVRRAVIKEFLAASIQPRICGRCKGISPKWRKDKFNKIFRKPLTTKERAKMVNGNFREKKSLVKAMEEKKAASRQRREDMEIDEGIGLSSEENFSEDEGEDIQMLDAGPIPAQGNARTAPNGKTKTRSTQETSESDRFVDALEIQASIAALFRAESEMMDLLYGSRLNHKRSHVTADMFFITHVLVTPNKYRPEAKTGDGEIAEAVENTQYKNIIKASEKMVQIFKEMKGLEQNPYVQRGQRELNVAWISLQDAVNVLIDSVRDAGGTAGKRAIEGIKQKLEKKEGLFRMNMMGKRVNFAARSVISPDPNIETNEVGVPPVFARRLTYPEPVTEHNFYELKQAVLNGMYKWPGAVAVESENGAVISLRTKNPEERQAIANQLLATSDTTVIGATNKKVHRHLANGDMVLMNRQPTLHKPSIMAHRARILPGEKTIRLHYANCNTYNADFDGDEMNLHFPQNEIARSEAIHIADTDHQYLAATSGKPLRGLIQDHISVSVWLTSRDTFFDREDYHQLLYSCLRPEDSHTITNRIVTIPPTVIKPRPLWTGKQILTSILENITPDAHQGLTFEGKSQTSEDLWGIDSGEGTVVFKDGIFVSGILDKAQIGPSGKGFVHSVFEAYGHVAAGRLLSILGRLLTKYLNMRAFTCGIDDLRLTIEGDNTRLQKLDEAQRIGLEVASKYVTLDGNFSNVELLSRLEDVLRDDSKQAGLDGVYSTRTSQLSSEVTSSCLPIGLAKPFPYNHMQTMTSSGAKGSNVNANQISCNLGQQVLEGRRVPTMISGKTLPSFKPFETKVRAGGYITNRFLTGIRPQEYFFHAMAGREGLIDTAVKTSRSGYLQRCLVKGMEGLKSEYDASVREADGSVVQFLYGEDGLDVTKQKHLTDFRFLAENHMSVLAELDINNPGYNNLKDSGAKIYNKKAMKAFKETGKWDAMDPVLALYNPGAVLGSTSESFLSALKKYCKDNPEGVLRDKKRSLNASITSHVLEALANAKYLKSTMEPGEAVGVVAAQSVGEPSTQMTLNTFHLAGHSAKNVTLGIPRLREIVMTASRSISTPMMTLHPIPEINSSDGEKFAKGISKLTMAEVIDEIQVSETISRGTAHERAKIYKVRLQLFPAAEYCETYDVSIGDVLDAIESKLVPEMAKAIKKEQKRKVDTALLKDSASQPTIGKSVRRADLAGMNEQTERGELNGNDGDDTVARPADGDDNDDADDNDHDDDDAKNSRRRQNQDEDATYEEPDEGEEAIAEEARRANSPDVEEPEDEGIGTSRPNSPQRDDEAAAELESRVKDKVLEVTKFAFDSERGEWCEIHFEYSIPTPKILPLPLMEEACRNAIIHAIPNLGECVYTKDDDPVSGKKNCIPVILTKGVNLQAMHRYQNVLDPKKIFTNDIAAMLEVYGVEACRGTIIREMHTVFKSHGISVDMRHLNLIGDVMTRSGGFTPFNRYGFKDSASPFMKMSFETTTSFLKDAILEGDWDDLKNPSARIVTGNVGKVGTGAFDVLMPIEREEDDANETNHASWFDARR